MTYQVGSKQITVSVVDNLFGEKVEVIRVDDLPAKVRRKFKEWMSFKPLIYHDKDWWVFFKTFRYWYEKVEGRDE